MTKPLLRPADTRACVEEHRFAAGDAMLTGRLHRPGTRPRAGVVLHGATGVPQSFYQPFAAWLAAEEGLAVLTYDYRDFGASATGHPRRSAATFSDWAYRDQPAAQAALERLVPETPLWVIGHSLGGMALSFQPEAGRIARVVTVASGLIRLGDHPWPYRALAASFWHGHGAAVTALAGYLPARLSGFKRDLPAGVYWQWRRWCNDPRSLLSDPEDRRPAPDWDAVRAPVKLVAVADDPMVPPPAVWRLMGYYPNAVKRQLTLRPADYGLRRIGHLGAFAPAAAAVWPALIA